MNKNILYFIIFICCLSLEVHASNEIILDPGHTKTKYGTRSCSGGLEYQYNNEMIEFIERYLKSNNIKILKTRSKNQEISLKERTRYSAGKKIFISIHHDSAQEQFINFKSGYPCSNYASGYSIFVSRKNDYFAESLQYAKILGTNLRKFGLTPTLHHAEKIKGENRVLLDKELGIYGFDELVVLKTSKCPAILFECGVIINPHDDFLVKSFDCRYKLAQSILEMILFDQRNKAQ